MTNLQRVRICVIVYAIFSFFMFMLIWIKAADVVKNYEDLIIDMKISHNVELEKSYAKGITEGISEVKKIKNDCMSLGRIDSDCIVGKMASMQAVNKLQLNFVQKKLEYIYSARPELR